MNFITLLLATLLLSQLALSQSTAPTTTDSTEDIQMDIFSTIYGDTLTTSIFTEDNTDKILALITSSRTVAPADKQDDDDPDAATNTDQVPTVSPQRCSVMRLIDDLKCVCFLAGRGQFNVPMSNMFRKNCRLGFMVRRLSLLRPFCNRYRRGPKRIIRPKLVRRAVQKSPILCDSFFPDTTPPPVDASASPSV